MLTEPEEGVKNGRLWEKWTMGTGVETGIMTGREIGLHDAAVAGIVVSYIYRAGDVGGVIRSRE